MRDTPRIVLIVALAIAGVTVALSIFLVLIPRNRFTFHIIILWVIPNVILSIVPIIFLVKGLKNDDFSRYPCVFFSVILILWSLSVVAGLIQMSI